MKTFFVQNNSLDTKERRRLTHTHTQNTAHLLLLLLLLNATTRGGYIKHGERNDDSFDDDASGGGLLLFNSKQTATTRETHLCLRLGVCFVRALRVDAFVY